MSQGKGWRPDLPDFRDYTPESARCPKALTAVAKQLPRSVDLREWCSPIEDQGDLGACTAHAAAGLYEYFERKAFGRYLDVSRRFLYKTTRRLSKLHGDSGAELRNAMGALVLFGAPPEEHWPYDVEHFDVEPDAFCYSFAQNYQAVTYYRLDPPGTETPQVLAALRGHLAAGAPAMFGFTCYSSLDDVTASGLIPFPGKGEKITGGHAILAVGYDDKVRCPNAAAGALLIRNSWGTAWGDHGYGWLPYDYVTRALAEDFWCMTKGEWVDTGIFA